MNIIFWEFLLLYQLFFSLQVERSVIISNKQGIYDLPDELPKDLVRKLGKIKNLLKICQGQCSAAKFPCPSPHIRNVYTAQKEIPHKKETCNHICTQHHTQENGALTRTSNLARLSEHSIM